MYIATCSISAQGHREEGKLDSYSAVPRGSAIEGLIRWPNKKPKEKLLMPATKPPTTDPLRIFSWGYDGWGNASKEFVKLADDVEETRGFAPPLFVDVRIRRAARAVGFRSRAFEELLGPQRYRWISGLGNRAVITREDGVIQIAEPSAVSELLNVALQAAQENRRLLYFCSCPYPGTVDHPLCHRTKVGTLLLEEATRRGLSITLQEWPGGAPQIRHCAITPRIRAQVEAIRSTISLDGQFDLADLGSLPYASLIVFGEEGDTVPIRRLRYGAKGWGLESLAIDEPSDLAGGEKRQLRKMLEQNVRDGFGERSTDPRLKPKVA